MADLTVYIDFKSPYAYLAIEPTRRLAHELGVSINWLPFVLDIPSYLGSAKLDKSGAVKEQSRSKDQWSGVKYAYYDCRRYANLRGLTIRGTEKIWDSSLAAIGMLWAKQQGDEVMHAYLDGVYAPFWKRELNIEDIEIIQTVLLEAGANVEGFADYVNQEGATRNQQIQESAFDMGVFGVPTYCLDGDLYFGREHLPRIAWHLGGKEGPSPDIANPLAPNSLLRAFECRELEVGIDLDDYESQCAIPEIEALAAEFNLILKWYSIKARKPADTTDPKDDSRSARHRRFRLAEYQRNRERYQPKTDDLDWNIEISDDQIADWAGGGLLGTPTFRIGGEVFVGRQHLPLLRAMYKVS
jgi:2-hydroxychromene-2-carboxylate isomerase